MNNYLKISCLELLFFRLNTNFEAFREGIYYTRILEYPIVINNLNLRKKDKILEIGCSYVNPVVPYLLAKNYNLSLIEKNTPTPNEDILIKCLEKENNIKINISVKDGKQTDTKKNYFDKIYSISAIEHEKGIGDIRIMDEIFRILKSKGRAVITVPFNKEKLLETEQEYGFERRYNLESIKKRLIGSRFKLKKIIFLKQTFKLSKFISAIPWCIKKNIGFLLNLFGFILWSKKEFNNLKELEKINLDKHTVVCLVLEK